MEENEKDFLLQPYQERLYLSLHRLFYLRSLRKVVVDPLQDSAENGFTAKHGKTQTDHLGGTLAVIYPSEQNNNTHSKNNFPI